ncbi:MAG: bifunctional riboflavin kinase/FAD synthetase [Ilumatobacteraceae bacterium]
MRVATIGNFDGVHRGHQGLVGRAVRRAGDDGSAVVITFDPHPVSVLRPDRAPARLTSLERRIARLERAGAVVVIVLSFTPELAAQSPEEFVRMLRDPQGANADVVIVGRNFRFGKGAAGDVDTLTDLGRELGFEVDVVDLVAEEIPGHGSVTLSSTYVRDCIATGDMRGAKAVLGRPHRVEGPVIPGDRRGRELGYPTANIAVEPGTAVPPEGVYAGYLVVDDVRLPAAISVGTNPQFGGHEMRVEAYAIGRDDLDLYGTVVGLDFVERLRGQEVFPTVDDLVAQMARDVAAAWALLDG